MGELNTLDEVRGYLIENYTPEKSSLWDYPVEEMVDDMMAWQNVNSPSADITPEEWMENMSEWDAKWESVYRISRGTDYCDKYEELAGICVTALVDIIPRLKGRRSRNPSRYHVYDIMTEYLDARKPEEIISMTCEQAEKAMRKIARKRIDDYYCHKS
ncbi:MAG: hypothetical protein J6Y37_11475 [Paludibacteraceae bacterium]|nr:hypothetical protein [Paludibacteraceae bacterium]